MSVNTDPARDWGVFLLIWAGACAMWVVLAERVARKYGSDIYRPGNAKPEVFVRQAPIMGKIGKVCLVVGVLLLAVYGLGRVL